eukprot:3941009-Rhodomonas_salina.6
MLLPGGLDVLPQRLFQPAQVPSYAVPTPCSVLTSRIRAIGGIVLRCPYAMSGTDMAYQSRGWYQPARTLPGVWY